MIDYGTIVVFFQKGLTYDQRASIVHVNVENQLLTSDRKHFIEIMNQCLEISKIVENDPFTITWNFREYRYKFSVEMVDNESPSLKC